MTARSIATLTLTSTLALALALASGGKLQAAEPSASERCASVGDVVADSFDRIAAALPGCEADPRLGNSACSTVAAMAGLVEQAGLMPMIINCAASGHTLGAQTYRISGLMTDVGDRLTALAANLQE